MFTFHNHLVDRITLNLNHGFVVIFRYYGDTYTKIYRHFIVDGQKHTLCVLIDLSKAFECVDHNIIESMYSIILTIKILANIRLIGSKRLEMVKGRSLRDKKLRSAINQSRNISPYRETADKAIYSEIRSIICLKWMRSSCQIVGKEELS